MRLIEFADSRPELDPTGELAELSMVDNAKFIELFEAMQPKYKWRKEQQYLQAVPCIEGGQGQRDQAGGVLRGC